MCSACMICSTPSDGVNDHVQAMQFRMLSYSKPMTTTKIAFTNNH